uniref:Uncharacterized protein n=1 Tax=Heterorhabditis bacteriophora TaxID=37862 RepID=A0A1I7WM13_HETBA
MKFDKHLKPLTNLDLLALVEMLGIKNFRGTFMRDTLPNKIKEREVGFISTRLKNRKNLKLNSQQKNNTRRKVINKLKVKEKITMIIMENHKINANYRGTLSLSSIHECLRKREWSHPNLREDAISRVCCWVKERREGRSVSFENDFRLRISSVLSFQTSPILIMSIALPVFIKYITILVPVIIYIITITNNDCYFYLHHFFIALNRMSEEFYLLTIIDCFSKFKIINGLTFLMICNLFPKDLGIKDSVEKIEKK